MSMYFPKRLELSFRRVLAFPKACCDRVRVTLGSCAQRTLAVFVCAYLQYWVGLQQSLSDSVCVVAGGTDVCVVLKDLFGGLSLSSATLTRNQNTLISSLSPQCTI